MTPGGLLAITAHPDDETLIAGGSLAACAAGGIETGVVCLTRGENGPIASPGLATRETLGEVRLRELREACDALGVGWLRCYRRADAHLAWTNGTAVARQLARTIAERRPAAIVTFGLDGLYGHDDHVATHRFAHRALELIAAERLVRRRPVLYEAVWETAAVTDLVAAAARRGLPSDLWGIEPSAFGVDGAGELVVADVRPFLERKLAALRAHRTQLDRRHLFSGLRGGLAERFFGFERFRRVGRARTGRDWLTEAVRAGAEAAGAA